MLFVFGQRISPNNKVEISVLSNTVFLIVLVQDAATRVEANHKMWIQSFPVRFGFTFISKLWLLQSYRNDSVKAA